MFTLHSDGILRADAFAALPWLEHGFETRESQCPREGFRVATLKQIHSARVTVVREERGVLGEADALATNCAAVLLSIRTADCVPILIADPDARAVAAVHAGWRGVVAGVLPRAVETMQAEFGSRPGSLLAAIGPCIRRDAFEVGEEVATQFQSLFPERRDLDRKTHVDLAEACARQLTRMGVPAGAVFDCGRCSYREAALFHSFRRDREASGRMAAFIGIRQ
mgnify:CR=1 FL=1